MASNSVTRTRLTLPRLYDAVYRQSCVASPSAVIKIVFLDQHNRKRRHLLLGGRITSRRKRRQTIPSTFVHLAVFEWGTVLSMGRADADGERARRA